MILWVEDDVNDVLLLERAFKKAGIAPVHICPNGSEAIRYLSGANEFNDREKFPIPSLIITDIMMPKATGLDLLRWLKDHPQCADFPVVVFSASAQDADIDEAYRLGANAYFQKPVGLEKITDVVGSILKYWREALPRQAAKQCG